MKRLTKPAARQLEAYLLCIRQGQLATGHPAALRIARGLGYRLETSPIMPRASILMPTLKFGLEHLPCG